MSQPAETDRIAGAYRQYLQDDLENSRWSDANPGNQANLRQRDALWQRALAGAGFAPLAEQRILEVGCGWGKVLADLERLGANPQRMVGVDLLPDSIALAREKFPQFRFEVANGEQLPLAAASFDLVFAVTMFTSILDDAVARRVAGEIHRVLRPGGAVGWYDFRLNNPRNRQVRGMTRTRVEQLFPGYEWRLQSASLLPPLARRLGRWTGLLFPALVSIPVLRSHYVGLLIKSVERDLS